MRRTWIGAIAVAALGVSAAPAQADTAVALVGGDTLLQFETETPETITATVPITGVTAGQTLRGIDFRPATGQLYGLAVSTGAVSNSAVSVYTIDPATGQATLVIPPTPFSLPGAADVPSGVTFTPVTDRIRYVTSTDENARINPNNGALAGNDSDLNPASALVISAAYDRSAPGSTQTTLFVINSDTDTFAIQGGFNGTGPAGTANGGVITDIFSLGLTLNGGSDGGLDIAPDGTIYAALTTGGVTGLYRVSSSAVLVGSIGSGASQVRELAIMPPDGDGDGKFDAADNCPAAPNADQADLDADGAGDPCDTDQDGDGLSDAVEIAIGSDPRSANSDSDPVPDGADACPTIAGTLPNGCPDTVLPDTVITAGPAAKTKKRGATFEFISTEPSTSFACSLDHKPFVPCSSPATFKKLRRTKHTFEVRAIDAVGNLDPTPATAAWKVKRKPAK